MIVLSTILIIALWVIAILAASPILHDEVKDMESPTLIEYVMGLDTESLKEVHCSFNAWMWPDALPERFKPVWWDGIPHIPSLTYGDVLERKYGFQGPITDYIRSRVLESDLMAFCKKWREENAIGGPIPA